MGSSNISICVGLNEKLPKESYFFGSVASRPKKKKKLQKRWILATTRIVEKNSRTTSTLIGRVVHQKPETESAMMIARKNEG